jgi:hypothetical protein
MGFAVELHTNSSQVIDCAAARWPDSPRLFENPALQLRVLVENGTAGPLPPAPVYRAREHLFTFICDQENFAICDFRCGTAWAWLASNVASNEEYLGYFVLDTMIYAMLSERYLTCVHASSVALGGRALLLCGPSGAGKTCLAYACAKRGFALVGDDLTAFPRRDSGKRIIGKLSNLRFRDTAASIIPELEGLPARVSANGKMAVELPAHFARIAAHAEAEAILFLDRREKMPPRLDPVDARQAIDRLAAEMPVITRSSYTEQLASLDWLAEVPAFEFRYSDLYSAVEHLTAFVRNRQ